MRDDTMPDNELRETFDQWAAWQRSASPPPFELIRRRARRRSTVLAAVSLAAVVMVAVAGIQVASLIGGRGNSPAPPAARGTHSAGRRPGNDRRSASGYAFAPYYLAASRDGASVVVWDAVTGTRLGTFAAPDEGRAGHRYPTIFASLAAADDDRTFVLAAVANTNSRRARPVWLFEVHLGGNGTPGRLHLLSLRHEQQGLVGHWYQNIASMALSPDASMLAIATNRAAGDTNGRPDIEVISLATGSTRTWTASPQDISSLSWAGDHTIAFACDGVCLLDTAKPGSSLSGARVVIPWSTRYRHLQGLQWPMITPNGADIYVAMEGGGLALVEFSASTGRPIRIVLGPRPVDGAFCGTLGSDRQGRKLVATCAWGAATGTITGGRFHRDGNLPPADPESGESGAGGYVIAW